MTYERTVAAAVAETKSKFALAEALAEDIPPRRSGPSDDATINEYIAEARQEIIDGGGEPKAIRTLADYRLTALWVSPPGGRNYEWVPGASFTAHRRAMDAGLSYDEFVALPKHTGDAANEAGGRAPVRGLSAMGSWTSEQKVEAARELLNEPDVAEQVADEITDYVASDHKRTADVVSKRRQQQDSRERDTESAEPIEWHERPQRRDYDALIEQHVNGLSVALAAESSEKWTPSERSEALLYFLTQILGKRREPTGDEAEFVNDKLDSLFAEVEAYANAEVA